MRHKRKWVRLVEAEGDLWTVLVDYPPRTRSEIPYYINGELSVFCAILASGSADENKVFEVAVHMSQAAMMDELKFNYNQIIAIGRILLNIHEKYKDNHYNTDYDFLFNTIQDDIDIIYDDIAFILNII